MSTPCSPDYLSRLELPQVGCPWVGFLVSPLFISMPCYLTTLLFYLERKRLESTYHNYSVWSLPGDATYYM